jgi:isopenicillin-N N-acyltransferase like protein
MTRVLKIAGYSVLLVIALVLLAMVYINYGLSPDVPVTTSTTAAIQERTTLGKDHYAIHHCWLRKSDSGLWEEYLEGAAYERGLIAGRLTSELMYKQEDAFVAQIHQLVPSDGYLRFLRYFTRVFNRHLSAHIPLEYRQEIYGESLSAPHAFDYVGEPYDRMLNYHAAHDIGHALQSLALVGCTSFAVWDSQSVDGGLLIGRNFDFYAGDRFAEDKVVLFCKPDSGYRFAMVTWAGMMGCTSGMNETGLTVTINAAKSTVPTQSATPISLLAREILQYARTIDEAYSIARRRKTFVSETLMIGCAATHTTALIEKSPTQTALLRASSSEMLCANHYQSDTFAHQPDNEQNIRTSASMYRYERLKELMASHPHIDYHAAAAILRDRGGKAGKDIGMGNEKAMNQLQGHHSVIFAPERRLMWVSTAPYQLGAFVCYDLNKVFAAAATKTDDKELYEPNMRIAADTFLTTPAWRDYLVYRRIKEQIKTAIHVRHPLADKAVLIDSLTVSNPQFWETYYWAGAYEQVLGEKKLAIRHFEIALTKEINATSERDKVTALLAKCKQ